MSIETARRVLRIEAQAIQDVMARLDGTFEEAVELLFGCKGRVAVTGMGKSGIVARKISATLSSGGGTARRSGNAGAGRRDYGGVVWR